VTTREVVEALVVEDAEDEEARHRRRARARRGRRLRRAARAATEAREREPLDLGGRRHASPLFFDPETGARIEQPS
jgi:hypothetical protein